MSSRCPSPLRFSLQRFFSVCTWSRAALRILDWTGLKYERGNRETVPITHEVMWHALRIEGKSFNADEQYVPDCFDHLFDHFENLEHLLQIGLIRFDDVEIRIEYYVRLLNRNPQVFERFLSAYGFALASQLLQRFKPAVSSKEG